MSVRIPSPLKRNRLSAALLSALILPGIAFAQSTDATQEDQEEAKKETSDAKTLDKVQVVGSRIKRAEIETASPVQIISREQLEQEGHQSVGDMLQTLTQGTTGDFTGDYYTNGFTPNAQTINLRAIGPGYTLVLVNGRRPSQYPSPYNSTNNITNVRTIPSSIIERSEVLAGGASAIYGSDAVAGVVNLVTRKNYDGNQARVTVGTTAEGGGDYFNFELTGGRSGDNWSVVWALQHSENEPIFAFQRELTSDIRSNPFGMTVNPQLSLLAADGLGRNVPAGHNLIWSPQICDALGYESTSTAARGNFCGSWSQVAWRSLYNKQDFNSAYVNGTLDIGESTQLFASVSLYENNAISSSGVGNFYSASDQFMVNRSGALSGGYYWDPNFNTLVLLQRFFQPAEMGGMEKSASSFEEKTYAVDFGITGTLGRFDWEASANYGKYDFTWQMPRLKAKAVHDYFLGERLGWASDFGAPAAYANYPVYRLNVDRWTSPLSTETFNDIYTRVTFNHGVTTSQSANFNISGDLFELPAGPLSFAGVLEAHRQTYKTTPDWRLLEPLGENTIYGLGNPGMNDGTRDRYATGVEFRVPVFSWLTVATAGRYDRYDDITQIDDAKTWNVGLEIRPFSNLLIRGNYATSFRAPDMQMVYSEGAASYSTILDEYACRSGQGLGQTTGPRTYAECNRSGDPTIYSVRNLRNGNAGLKEEEGESWGYGFVWDIIDNMSLSVDYFDIKLEDRAVSLTASELLRSEAECRLGTKRDGSPADYPLESAYCQSVLNAISRNGPVPGTTLDLKALEVNSTYLNAAYQRVSGVDATFNYRWDTDRLGRFGVNLGWSLELSDEYKKFASDPLVDYRDQWDYNSRSRTRGSFSWSKGDWSAATFFTRYGSVVNWAETHRLKPWFLWNLNVGKKFGPNTSATLQVNNVFNNQYRHDDTYTGYPYYMGGYGSDLQGRRFYLTLSHKF